MARVQVHHPHDGVAEVLLDDPPMNFGSYALLDELHRALVGAREEGHRVVVLNSAVPGYFMAHAWLPDVVDAYEEPASLRYDPRLWRDVTHELERGPMVSIAVNHGQAWGGGAELSWACNLRIATRQSTYAQIEARLGVIPGGGGTARLARLAGQATALKMLLAAEPMSGEELHRLGVVGWLHDDPGAARAGALEIARKIAALPARAVTAGKRGVLQTWDLGSEDALRLEGHIFNSTMRPATIERLREIQKLYDSGLDSWGAYGIQRP